MLTRIHKSMREKDQGFTLIELLVVMIIIGILAAIAIPVFLSQRAKARDSSTKADVSTLGKEIATYYVDGSGTGLAVTYTAATATAPAQVVITDTAGYASGIIKLSSGTVQPAANATANLTNSSTWCVALMNASGSTQNYHYSGDGGLQSGTC